MNPIAQDYEVRIWYSDEDEGFIAQVVDMPGISAVGDSREDAAREIQVALDLALATYAEDGVAAPVPSNPAAAALGRLGGSASTRAKVLAARENGKKGGRPKANLDGGDVVIRRNAKGANITIKRRVKVRA